MSEAQRALPRTDTLPRVDAHAHVFRRDLPLAPNARHAPQRDALLDEYLGLLDRHGITHAVLTAPSFLGTDNSFLLRALAREPARLRGTVIVDPDVDTGELRRLQGSGVTGVRLNFFGMQPLPAQLSKRPEIGCRSSS